MLKSLRHALRLLLKAPGFTLVSICSLAIGIGATSAMFSFADALILRPLPVLEPTRIAAVTTASTEAEETPEPRCGRRDQFREFDKRLVPS